jgi:hypothetical protein
MTDQIISPLLGETLVTIAEAAKDFGGIQIPINTLRNYIYQGVQGVKLESIFINRRLTSREAILRFIARRQGHSPERPIVTESQKEIEEGLRKHGIIK